MFLNKVMFVGNLVNDAEVRVAPSGVAVGSFRLAVNTPMGKDEQGNVKYDAMFIDVVVFGKRAEALSKYLSKGTKVYVEGKLRYRTWENKDGNKHSKHEVILTDLQFAGSKKEDSQDQVDEDGVETDTGDGIPF